MDDMTFVYIAYAIIWVALFMFLLKLHMDQTRLKKEIEVLKEVLGDGRKAGRKRK